MSLPVVNRLRPFTAVLIIPTGIGARIGGFAGDAIPVVRALAQVCDCLITHPNVLNGAQLYWSLPNVLYVEGYGLDQFAAGTWGLQPVHQNTIGLILDQGIEPDLRCRQLQAAVACQATLGLMLRDYILTDAPLDVSLSTAASGATWGTIGNPGSLLRAAAQLLQAGATAIAVVARFPDDFDSPALYNYRQGKGVDPLAGAEAVISHLVVRQFQVPCAHAPALLPLPLDPDLSPRSAAEEIGYTFLPSVLVGLSRAPQFIPTKLTQTEQVIQAKQNYNSRSEPSGSELWRSGVDMVIVPASACGGSAVISFAQTPTQLITVAENQTTMQADAKALGLQPLAASSYLEAVGMVAAIKAGIAPSSLSASAPELQQLG